MRMPHLHPSICAIFVEQMGIAVHKSVEEIYFFCRKALFYQPGIRRKLASCGIKAVLRRPFEMDFNLLDSLFFENLCVHDFSTVCQRDIGINHGTLSFRKTNCGFRRMPSL